MIMTTLIRAMIDSHLAAAKILQAALNDVKQKEALTRGAIHTDRVSKGSGERTQTVDTVGGERLCTIDEAQLILRVSRSKIYGLIAEKLLPVVKIGKATRIRRTDLKNLITPRTS